MHFFKKQVEIDLLRTTKTQGEDHYFKPLFFSVAFRPQEQGTMSGLRQKLE